MTRKDKFPPKKPDDSISTRVHSIWFVQHDLNWIKKILDKKKCTIDKMFKCSADKRRVSPAQSFPRFFLLLLFFSFPSPLMLWILCDKSKGSRCTTTVHRHQPLCDSISVMSGSRSNAVKEKRCPSQLIFYILIMSLSLSLRRSAVVNCSLFSLTALQSLAHSESHSSR